MVWLKVLGWCCLAIGSAGGIVRANARAPSMPSVGESMSLVGFALLVVRSPARRMPCSRQGDACSRPAIASLCCRRPKGSRRRRTYASPALDYRWGSTFYEDGRPVRQPTLRSSRERGDTSCSTRSASGARSTPWCACHAGPIRRADRFSPTPAPDRFETPLLLLRKLNAATTRRGGRLTAGCTAAASGSVVWSLAARPSASLFEGLA